MSKISIIIPTHNDGKYLQQCLQSIKNQEFQDFECIIVDDGSTDDTHQIASEFSALDNRFFYYHQQQSGQSAARRRALSFVHGELLTFVDGDDFLESDHLYRMQELFTRNVQMVVTAYFEDFRRKAVAVKLPSGYTSDDIIPDKTLRSLLISGELKGFLCNKMFRSELFAECKLHNTFNFMEDVREIANILERNEICASFQMVPTYHYRQRSGSSVNKIPSTTEYVALQETMLELIKLCENRDQLRLLSRQYQRLLMFELSKENKDSYFKHLSSIQQQINIIYWLASDSRLHGRNILEDAYFRHDPSSKSAYMIMIALKFLKKLKRRIKNI